MRKSTASKATATAALIASALFALGLTQTNETCSLSHAQRSKNMSVTNSQVYQLNESGFDSSVSSGLVLVDFWAPWCGPCQAMGPVLSEFAASVDGAATVAKVNVDENPNLATRFRVQSIPLIVLLKDGQEVERKVGVQSVNELKKLIELHV